MYENNSKNECFIKITFTFSQLAHVSNTKLYIFNVFFSHHFSISQKTPSHLCRSNIVLTEHFQFDSDFPWRPLFVFWFNFFWLVGTSNPRRWLVENSVTRFCWKSPYWRHLTVAWRYNIGASNDFFENILALF